VTRCNTLQRMLSSLGNTFREDAVFLGLFFLAFFALALLGLDLFSGSGWSCTDTQKTGPDTCFGVFSATSVYGTSIMLPVAWKGSSFSSFDKGFFDDIWMSMQSLVHVLSLEGWLTIFYSAADLNVDTDTSMSPTVPHTFWTSSNQLLLQPMQNKNSTSFVFFLFFIVFFSFFLLQMFVATVLSNIMKKSPTGSLTKEQLQWLLLKKQLKHEIPIVPTQPIDPKSLSASAMINRKEFDMLVLSISVLNVAFIAAAGSSSSQNQRSLAL
jgi:hypothetical protein